MVFKKIYSHVTLGFSKYRCNDRSLKYSNFMVREGVEGRELHPIWSANIKLFLKSDLSADSMSLSR